MIPCGVWSGRKGLITLSSWPVSFWEAQFQQWLELGVGRAARDEAHSHGWGSSFLAVFSTAWSLTPGRGRGFLKGSSRDVTKSNVLFSPLSSGGYWISFFLHRYRKLPHCHYPVSFQDCLSATIHFLKTSQLYGVDPSRIVVSGDSIGGGAVAFVTQTLVGRTDIPKLRAQILIYPIVQGINLQLPSFQQNKDLPVLTRDIMIICFCQYLRIDLSWKDALLKGSCIPDHIWEKYKKWLSSDNLPERFRHKDYQPEIHAPFNEAAYLETRHIFEVANAPLIADDQIISQLPEALIVTCEWDILRDDGLLYKKRLEDQGVPVTWFHIEDGFHGCTLLFDSMLFHFPCTKQLMNATVKYLRGI
ncbi:arylacetamide deacetylase-like 4 [Thomomys bottae]